MASRTASDWCTTKTGASETMFNCESVTTIAISIIRSLSGSSPVISMSSQRRLFWSCAMPLFRGPLCRMALSHNRLRFNALVHRCFYHRARAHRCDAPVAFAAAHPLRPCKPRFGSCGVLGEHSARGASEGGGLYGRENTAWNARDARRRRAAARALPRRRPAAPLRSVGTCIRSGRLRARHCADHFGGACFHRDRSPLCPLSHLRARGALRFQSHQLGVVFRRPREAGGARGVAAGPARFLLSMAHGENGSHVVALCVGDLGCV